MSLVSGTMSLSDDRATGVEGLGGGGRPYTVTTFHDKVRQFEKMLDAFTLRNVEASPDERRQMISDNAAAFSKFCSDVRELFGSNIRDDDLQQLYRKVQANPDSNVDWSEVFGYFNVAREDEEVDDGNDVSIFATPLRRCVGDAAGGKKRRDVAKSIRFIKALDSFVVAAQRGTVTFWSKKLELTSFSTVEDTLWIADCDYLPNMKKMICCTEKSLLIWDPRTKANSSRIFAIRPFTNVLHSMCVLPHPKVNEDVVLVGDDSGNICAITISSQDLVSKSGKAAQAINIEDIVPVDPTKLLTPVVIKKVHPTAVSVIKFFPELNCFGSCSSSATTSFVLEEVHRLQATEELRGFSIPKGLTCFDYSVSTNLIATGGPDKIIRLFIPHIDKPTGKLKGHLFTITGICVNDTDKHVISLSSARVVRIWDMLTMANLQVFSDKEDRLGEKRIHCIMFDPNLEVLITCSSVIECWPLTRNTQGSSQIPVTHDKPIALMLHHEALGQLITICTVPVTIKVWDIKSGKVVYKISDPHGRSVEVTAATIDAGGYKMATGGADGTLKTWDFGSGRQLKTLPDDLIGGSASRKDKASVIQAVCVHKLDKYRLLAAYNLGGNFMLFSDVEKIQFFQYLCNMDDELVAKGRGVQKEKVTCTYFLPPDCLITGMTDGALAFWSLKKRRTEKVFALPKKDEPARPSSDADDGEQSDQVNAMAVFRCYQRAGGGPTPLVAEAAPDDSESTTGAAPEDGADPRDDGGVGSPSSSPEASGNGVGGDGSGGGGGEGRAASPETARETTATIIIATAHQDATLRFWDQNGNVLLETVPEMKQTNQAPTAIAVNSSATYAVTGDSSGFLTLFRIARFSSKIAAKADCSSSSNITQVVTWRGHLSRVVNIAIVTTDGRDVTYSASIDGSVRVWTGNRGHYVGYLGQALPLDVANSGDTEGAVVKPCDISESPVEYEEMAKRESRPKNPPKLEVPLVHAKHRRSEYGGSGSDAIDEGVYFKSLEKPKPYRDHLPVVEEPKHSNKDGFVFRSLPVYQVITPERIKTPTPVLEKGLKSRSIDNAGKPKKKR